MSLSSWFGNSKVVDKDGKPLVVYHGSPEKFEVFEPDRMNYGSISRGFCFFTNKKSAYPNCAKDYAGKDGYIYECYLKIEKPLHLTYINTPENYYHTPVHFWDTCQSDIRRDFRKGDFDGIIIENTNKDEDDSVIYLVPKANQIKSVDAKEFTDSENIYEMVVYHGGSTKEESDGLKYYALDKRYIKLFHPNAKISKCEIEPKNTFDYANPEHVKMLLDKLPEEIVVKDNYRRQAWVYTKEQFKRLLEGDKDSFGNWNLLEDKSIQNIIRDLGFDSMYLLEYSMSGAEWKNIAMFESLNKQFEKLL